MGVFLVREDVLTRHLVWPTLGSTAHCGQSSGAMRESYVDVNRANWNSRVPFHARGYQLDKFRADPSWLSEVVRFDQPRLGDVRGLDLVHLQCHVGSDTLSLSRLGANVTGLDFSEPALDVARELARDCDARISYVEAEVYDAVRVLGEARF